MVLFQDQLILSICSELIVTLNSGVESVVMLYCVGVGATKLIVGRFVEVPDIFNHLVSVQLLLPKFAAHAT